MMRFRAGRIVKLLFALAGPAVAMAEPAATGPRVKLDAGIVEGVPLGTAPRAGRLQGDSLRRAAHGSMAMEASASRRAVGRRPGRP